MVDLLVDFGEYVKSAVVPILLLLGGWIRSSPWLLVSFLQNGFEIVCVIRSLERNKTVVLFNRVIRWVYLQKDPIKTPVAHRNIPSSIRMGG